jgi:hypothetical protein
MRCPPLLLFLLLCACGDSTTSSTPVHPDGFGQDELQAAVDRILPRVEEIRGWTFSSAVPAGVQSTDEFMEFAMKEFEEEYGIETFRARGQAYGLLGLVSPKEDFLETFLELLRGQVGGYYDPKRKTFYMIDAFNKGALADIIMAHELTHALDDQRFDLAAMAKKVKGNSDAEFAMRSVVEGSGTSLMNLYTLKGAKEGWLDMAEMARQSMEMQQNQAAALQKSPQFLVITLALPYLEGNKFLAKTSNFMKAMQIKPTHEDLDMAFKNPPRSSEQVLHPEKYWDPDKLDEPIPTQAEDVSATLGEGWASVDSDVLGELGCFVMTVNKIPNLGTLAGMAAPRVTSASAGWGGDEYRYFRHKDEGRALLWQVDWDTRKDAEEFLEALHGKQKTNSFFHSATQKGNRITAWFGDSKGVAAISQLNQ